MEHRSIPPLIDKRCGGPETPPPAEQAEASQNILTEEMGPVAAESTAVRSELKGALLEVWRQWAGNDLPPVLSLTTGKQIEDLHMDAQTLEKERVRIMVMLEKDAQKRLAVIEKAGNNGSGSIDAACRIYLSKDKMAAWSFVFPPMGEGKLRGEAIGKALEESGVTTGIDPASMVCIFQEPQYFKLVPIAIGTPPVEGVSGSITERYPRELSHEVKLDENGVADYRALNYVQLIEKDAVICDITLPQPGEAGLPGRRQGGGAKTCAGSKNSRRKEHCGDGGWVAADCHTGRTSDICA